MSSHLKMDYHARGGGYLMLKVSKYVSGKIKRCKTDFTLQTFKSGGKGGQHQNKTESGVRIIDKITGLSGESREERDQLQNKKVAFDRLVSRMIRFYQEEEIKQDYTNDEVVRIYRPRDSIVKDSRVDDVEYHYKDILNGKLEKLIEDIQLRDNT